MPGELTWYVARASGLVAWALMVVATLWGLLLVSRVLERRPSPAWLLDLHKHLSLLAVALTVIHLGALWQDEFVEFSPAELFIPMMSEHERTAVALGAISVWLMVLVEISSRLRTRLSRRTWRVAHMLSAPLVVAATTHGVLIGTDLSNPLVAMIGLVLGAELVLVLGLRVTGGRRLVPLMDASS